MRFSKVLGSALLGLMVSVPPAIAQEPAAGEAKAVVERHIVVQGGYSPSRVEVPPGQPVRLVFERREYSSCTKEVVFPSLKIRRELPPNVPVAIDLGPQDAGEIEFHCGMKMIRGKVVVAPAKSL